MKTKDKSLLTHFKSEKHSVEERFAAGKELRRKFPRNLHGEYKPAPDRADPVSILIKQGKGRLRDLVPVRYARMLTSPFAFLRGGAAIMAADLAASVETFLYMDDISEKHRQGDCQQPDSEKVN